MNKIQNEWTIFKRDFKKLSDDSLLFRINWYILKPLALILCIVLINII